MCVCPIFSWALPLDNSNPSRAPTEAEPTATGTAPIKLGLLQHLSSLLRPPIDAKIGKKCIPYKGVW